MSLRQKISAMTPNCGCLPTLGCGALIFVTIVAPPQIAGSSSSVALAAAPVQLVQWSNPVSALLIVSWIITMVAFDDCGVVKLLTDWWNQGHQKRADNAALKRQKQAVLEELTTTGLLSHMMRNPHSRILTPLLEARG